MEIVLFTSCAVVIFGAGALAQNQDWYVCQEWNNYSCERVPNPLPDKAAWVNLEDCSRNCFDLGVQDPGFESVNPDEQMGPIAGYQCSGDGNCWEVNPESVPIPDLAVYDSAQACIDQCGAGLETDSYPVEEYQTYFQCLGTDGGCSFCGDSNDFSGCNPDVLTFTDPGSCGTQCPSTN